MTEYQLVAESRVAGDLRQAIAYYERQLDGLGRDFLDQVSAVYDRIGANLFKYQVLRSDIRRALCRRFPYSVFFAIEGDVVVILAVLHSAVAPAKWQELR